MPTVAIEHIELDERGIARISGTRMRVINVVLDMINGLSPVQIQEGYPELSLAQIHAALAYYYDHKQEIDTKIETGLREVEILRRQSKQPTKEELLQQLRDQEARKD